MKTIYPFISSMVFSALLLCSCVDDLMVNEHCGYISVDFTDAGIGDNISRAAYSGISVSFEDGDAIGIYAVNGSGTVQASNIQYTKSGDEWTSSTPIAFNLDWKYYAYFPYVASPYTPDFSASGIDNQFSAFISDTSDKFHYTNQSTKAKFTASDLMIADGDLSGTNTVHFSMYHKKGLAVLQGGGVHMASYSGNIPYSNGSRRYFWMKPDVKTTIGGCSASAQSGKYVDFMIPLPPLEEQYLTFTALEDGTFTLRIGTNVSGKGAGEIGPIVPIFPAPRRIDIEPIFIDESGNYIESVSYSVDNGATWIKTDNATSATVTITTPTIPAGGKVLWKGIGNSLAAGGGDDFSRFSSTGRFDISGNIMSLVKGDDFRTSNTLEGEYNFYRLFYENANLISASDMILPATTLADCCYRQMFSGCTSLTAAPELPAATLVTGCYRQMFSGCTSLTNAPELPATTLAQYCYVDMFYDCSSLTTVPKLPATTLADYCYDDMFGRCTSLTTIPADLLAATTLTQNCYESMFTYCTSLTVVPSGLLPATALAQNCYKNMFYRCTSLTAAPELPATTLANNCYQNMFYACSSLTSAPKLPATTLANYCYKDMFYGCSSLTSAPKLPATTLANYCYEDMFMSCTSLTNIPSDLLPATTLANYCYHNMFSGCTSLTTIPSDLLPATTLKQSCYQGMFGSCTSLTSIPSNLLPATTLSQYCYQNMFQSCISLATVPSDLLPATILADACYDSMFNGCSLLTEAPELPATTLRTKCYQYMFNMCSSLSYIKAAFTTTPSTSYTSGWVKGVSSTGSFLKNSAATWNVTGYNGVPSGWTVETYTP